MKKLRTTSSASFSKLARQSAVVGTTPFASAFGMATLHEFCEFVLQGVSVRIELLNRFPNRETALRLQQIKQAICQWGKVVRNRRN